MPASCSGWLCLPAGELVAQHSRTCRHPMQSSVDLLAAQSSQKEVSCSSNDLDILETKS